MKKSIIIVLMLAFSAPAFSQMVGAVLPISFGPKVVVNQSMLDVDNSYAEVTNNFGGGVGGFFRLTLLTFVIQPEAYFNYRSNDIVLPVEDKESGSTYNFDYSATISSVDIPVLIGFQPIGLPIFKLRFMLGPVINLNLSETVEVNSATVVTTNGTATTGSTDVDVEEVDQDFESMFYGAQFGVGADIGPITLDVRYEYGFSPVAIEHDASKIRSKMIDKDMGQSQIHFGIGYKIL